MWQPLKLITGRWFVVRDRLIQGVVRREFLKRGSASIPFGSEAAAQGRADKVNSGSGTP
jgi:hypothetical protein